MPKVVAWSLVLEYVHFVIILALVCLITVVKTATRTGTVNACGRMRCINVRRVGVSMW